MASAVTTSASTSASTSTTFRVLSFDVGVVHLAYSVASTTTQSPTFSKSTENDDLLRYMSNSNVVLEKVGTINVMKEKGKEDKSSKRQKTSWTLDALYETLKNYERLFFEQKVDLVAVEMQDNRNAPMRAFASGIYMYYKAYMEFRYGKTDDSVAMPSAAYKNRITTALLDHYGNVPAPIKAASTHHMTIATRYWEKAGKQQTKKAKTVSKSKSKYETNKENSRQSFCLIALHPEIATVPDDVMDMWLSLDHKSRDDPADAFFQAAWMIWVKTRVANRKRKRKVDADK